MSNALQQGHAFEVQKDHSFDLLEGAASSVSSILSEIDAQKRTAADSTQPLDVRLEAFEDIYESEVGDTTLSRARNIEREIGLRQLYLKFEGNNPTGTHKDRIAFAQVQDALRRGYDTITLATCGNYGVAMAFASSLAGLRCVIFIPESYHTKRMQEIERLGAEVYRTSGDYETAVKHSSQVARERDYYDANPGAANTDLQLRAYGQIAYEIYDDLRDAPALVAVPVSNGTTVAGIYRGFVSLYRRGKTSRIPRLVAGSSYSKNPIINAFLKHLPMCKDLDPLSIHESTINEPLINWHSIDGDLALDAIRLSNGWASYASDKSMTAFSKVIREQEGLHVMPASTAGLLALLQRHKEEPLPSDRYVVILTGRR